MLHKSILVVSGVIAAFLLAGCTMDVEGRVEKLRQQSEANIAKEKAFLAENRNKPGVHETASGLQYRVISSGNGAMPGPRDEVTVNYRGRLLDGTEFDSSYKRGKPATFPVNRLIPGWTEALQLMHVGDHWEIYVPAKLAYGKKSPSRDIPPSSLLVFEMELLGVNGG